HRGTDPHAASFRRQASGSVVAVQPCAGEPDQGRPAGSPEQWAHPAHPLGAGHRPEHPPQPGVVDAGRWAAPAEVLICRWTISEVHFEVGIKTPKRPEDWRLGRQPTPYPYDHDGGSGNRLPFLLALTRTAVMNRRFASRRGGEWPVHEAAQVRLANHRAKRSLKL